MRALDARRLALAAVLASLGPAVAGAQNLVDDPGFERGGIAWSLLDYASSVVDGAGRGGGRALKLLNDFDGDSSAPCHNARQSDIAGVEGGREYLFEVWVEGRGVEGIGAGGKPLAVLQWLAPSGERLGREMYMWAPYGTYGYQQMLIHSEAPAGAAMANVGFRSWWDCTGGSTFWDDISLAVRPLSWEHMVELETHQAEAASARLDAVVAAEHEGFTGAGYLELGGDGASVEWTGVRGGPGVRTLVLRYAMEAGSVEVDLTVNGGSEGTLTLVPTGSPDSWATIGKAVALARGDNDVRIEVLRRFRKTSVDALLVYGEEDPVVEPDGGGAEAGDGDIDGDVDGDIDGDIDGDADDAVDFADDADAVVDDAEGVGGHPDGDGDDLDPPAPLGDDGLEAVDELDAMGSMLGGCKCAAAPRLGPRALLAGLLALAVDP